jgi:hypothetical protein
MSDAIEGSDLIYRLVVLRIVTAATYLNVIRQWRA